MPGIGYTFQDTDMNGSGGNRTWIVIAVVVTLATVGVILLVRAFGDQTGEKPVESSNREEGTGKREQETGNEPTNRQTDKPANRQTDKPTNRQTDKPTNHQTPKLDLSEASEKAAAFMRAGEAAEKADDLYAARTNYLAALADPGCGKARPVAEARLGVVDVELIFSPREMEGKIDYAIASGDSLKKIANRHGTTVDLIVKGNSVPNPDRVQVGDRLAEHRVVFVIFKFMQTPKKERLIFYKPFHGFFNVNAQSFECFSL